MRVAHSGTWDCCFVEASIEQVLVFFIVCNEGKKMNPYEVWKMIKTEMDRDNWAVAMGLATYDFVKACSWVKAQKDEIDQAAIWNGSPPLA